jgi:hypothetical protein
MKNENIDSTVTIKTEINFKLLAKQKRTILGLIDKVGGKKSENIEGIVNLIDHIQDQAVSQGIEEKVVFPFLKKYY